MHSVAAHLDRTIRVSTMQGKPLGSPSNDHFDKRARQTDPAVSKINSTGCYEIVPQALRDLSHPKLCQKSQGSVVNHAQVRI